MAAVPHNESGSTDGSSFMVLPAPTPDIAGNAARIGSYVWSSARLFEITGGWATTDTDDRRKVIFAGASGRFAWQADEWRRRLPFLREVRNADLIVAPDERAAVHLDRLASLEPGERADELAGVIAQLDAAYRSHAEGASPVRDGPILRSLERIRGDLARLTAEISDIRHTITTSERHFPGG